MCNCLHPESKPIPKSGIGWKLFRPNGDMLQFGGGAYKTDPDGWVRWHWRGEWHDEDNCGFCFFRTKRGAEKWAQEWYNHTRRNIVTLCKIEYEDGLGSHVEHHFIHPHRVTTALCRKFRVIE